MTVVVKTSSGIAKQKKEVNITTLKYNVKIKDIKLSWTYWEYMGKYDLKSVNIYLENYGQEFTLDKVLIELDGKSYSSWIYKSIPEGEVAVDVDAYIYDIQYGTYVLHLVLLDESGKVIAEKTTQVTTGK